MRKRIMGLCLTLCMLLSFAPRINAATIVDSGTCGAQGDNLTWTLDDEGTLTISGTGAMKDYNVYEVGSDAPWADYEYKKIIIEDGVTNIGKAAFYTGELSDKGYQSIEIPSSVERIGRFSISYSKNLKVIEIPDGVKIIDAFAFQCSGLTDITIPKSVEKIGVGVFSGDNSYGFGGYSSLKNINVDAQNKNYSSLNGNLFNKEKTELIAYGKGESTYIVPDSVNIIGDYAFQGCSSITNITIQNSVTLIGECAFSHCPNLSRITIPNNVATISDAAFYECANLKDVYFEGTKDEWSNINIGTSNECLTNATIHFAEPIEPYFEIAGSSVTNTSDNEQTAAIIIAEYNSDGALTNVNTETVKFSAGEEKLFQISSNSKIFVWDSLNGMQPLNQ